jgi:copper(I)-binding protein
MDSRYAEAMFMKAITAVLLSGFFIIAGCNSAPPDIQISDVVAAPSPVMRGVVSVFMRIENKGGSDRLVSSSTDVAGSIVELHDIDDGKMVKVKSIKIPSSGKVEMVPGGLHVMIFNLPKDIASDYEFTLYLDFEKSGRKSIEVKTLKS